MYVKVEKSKENESQSVTNYVTKNQSGGESTFQLVDNRPEAIAQRKLQAIANNSPKAMQLRAFQEIANSSQAKQAAQLQAMADNYSTLQQQSIQKEENKVGLPNNLRTGMESLSGMSLEHVKVHYNSSKPAAVQAHAYVQGAEIHLASGQEKHLPHELGHVVQQMEGRVKSTMQMNGMNVNDHPGLEAEATRMGIAALNRGSKDGFEGHAGRVAQGKGRLADNAPAQLMSIFDYNHLCKKYTEDAVKKALAGKSYIDVLYQELEMIILQETEKGEEGEDGVLPDNEVLEKNDLSGKMIIHGGEECGGGNCHGYAFSDLHGVAYDQGIVIEHLKGSYKNRPVTLYTANGVLMHSAKGVGNDCVHKMNVGHPVIACSAAEYMSAMGYEKMFELPRQKDDFLKEVGA